MSKKVILTLSIVCLYSTLFAQQKQIADKIIAVVGNSAILQSDLNISLIQRVKNSGDIDDSMKCDAFLDLVAEKILAEEALRDSTLEAKVNEDAINAEMQRRIDYYVQNQFHTVANMESYMGKTVYQMKQDMRETVKDNLLATEMRGKIMENVKVTPNDVQQFFNSLPDTEKVLLPASVEVGQIVIKPDPSPEIDKYTKDKLSDIRKQIIDEKKDFAMMAGIYSQDPGSKDEGGEVTIDRKIFDPAFVSAAYKLQPGEISPPIKSQFGYHIIQMEKRMGDQALVRHILIMPDITSGDIQKVMTKLDTVYKELQDKKITFPEAVAKYSNDRESKMTGGMVYDMATGSSILTLDNLNDPQMSLAINDMKVGEFSKPQEFKDNYGRPAVRILYLRSRTDPHQINLKDDYSRIQDAALKKKQNEYLMHWMEEKIPTHYIKLDPAYNNCSVLNDWYRLSSK